MKYKIRTNEFCGLSRNPKWQEWLKTIAPDLYQELTVHLSKTSGCKSNREIMIAIQGKLEGKGLSDKLIEFFNREFPQVIEKIVNAPISPSKRVEVNDRVVFGHYNPNMLTFPQKVIFENLNIEKLNKDVEEFCRDKIGCEFVVVKNRAYVEYFKPQFRNELAAISSNSRDVFKFKSK